LTAITQIKAVEMIQSDRNGGADSLDVQSPIVSRHAMWMLCLQIKTNFRIFMPLRFVVRQRRAFPTSMLGKDWLGFNAQARMLRSPENEMTLCEQLDNTFH
jgi:hypothetical protein